MIDSEALKKLLEKDVSRKQFLQYVGTVIIGLIGINSLISAFLKPTQKSAKPSLSNVPSRGFGTSKYGK